MPGPRRSWRGIWRRPFVARWLVRLLYSRGHLGGSFLLAFSGRFHNSPLAGLNFTVSRVGNGRAGSELDILDAIDAGAGISRSGRRCPVKPAAAGQSQGEADNHKFIHRRFSFRSFIHPFPRHSFAGLIATAYYQVG